MSFSQALVNRGFLTKYSISCSELNVPFQNAEAFAFDCGDL